MSELVPTLTSEEGQDFLSRMLVFNPAEVCAPAPPPPPPPQPTHPPTGLVEGRVAGEPVEGSRITKEATEH